MDKSQPPQEQEKVTTAPEETMLLFPTTVLQADEQPCHDCKCNWKKWACLRRTLIALFILFFTIGAVRRHNHFFFKHMHKLRHGCHGFFRGHHHGHNKDLSFMPYKSDLDLPAVFHGMSKPNHPHHCPAQTPVETDTFYIDSSTYTHLGAHVLGETASTMISVQHSDTKDGQIEIKPEIYASDEELANKVKVVLAEDNKGHFTVLVKAPKGKPNPDHCVSVTIRINIPHSLSSLDGLYLGFGHGYLRFDPSIGDFHVGTFRFKAGYSNIKFKGIKADNLNVAIGWGSVSGTATVKDNVYVKVIGANVDIHVKAENGEKLSIKGRSVSGTLKFEVSDNVIGGFHVGTLRGTATVEGEDLSLKVDKPNLKVGIHGSDGDGNNHHDARISLASVKGDVVLTFP